MNVRTSWSFCLCLKFVLSEIVQDLVKRDEGGCSNQLVVVFGVGTRSMESPSPAENTSNRRAVVR